MEICEIKHQVIDREISELKDEVEDHDNRISSLEKVSYVRDEQIKNILGGMKTTNESINNLVSWIKWGLAFIIPTTLGLMVWLLQQQLIK